jgi:hypothetical protein
MLTDGQILTEIEKQKAWMENEPKQKEFTEFYTKRCEIGKVNTFCFMGTGWKLPEQFYMSFMLTNDHVERDENEELEIAMFNFDNLNFN